MDVMRNIILVIGFSVLSLSLAAQNRTSKKTSLSVNVVYGISGLTGSISDGNLELSQGTQYSLEGSYFVSSFVGLGIGVGYADYASTAKVNSYNSSIATIDEDEDNLEYRVKGVDISEKEKITAFEIPLFLTFRPIRSSKLHFEANAGVKISVPISSSYNYTNGTITTIGYYEKYNLELTDIPNHGFQTIDAAGLTGKLSTKTAFSVFARMGVVIPIGKLGLHIGVYGSYGINPILKPEYNALATYPGIYYSASSLSNKIILVSGGVRFGITI